MALSNSFHSSAKSHSIGSGAALSDCERHNERGYYSAYYSADKISLIYGESKFTTAIQDVNNDTFDPLIAEYNAKQRRRDRRIEGSAFEYFCDNKKLDIAVENIFQIGDMEFWGRWRQETIVQTKRGEVVLKNFPPEVKLVMDTIYLRQMQAYERIYETHGDEILAKIEVHYQKCQDVLASFAAEPELELQFRTLAEMKPEERQEAVKKLAPELVERFDDYFQAYHGVKDIEKKRYRERIRAGQMHIKLMNGTVHYDEFSPHGHAVSVCWADGFKSGLPSRLAKAVVLNRYCLEVLQDRMHEIAEEEIAKHPEIFGREELREKGEGRNYDYSTEQITRQKQQQLTQKVSELTGQQSRLIGSVGLLEIKKENLEEEIAIKQAASDELRSQNADLQAQISAGQTELADLNQQLADAKSSMQTTLSNKQEYDSEIAALKGPRSPMKRFFDAVYRFVEIVRNTSSSREQIIDAAFAMLKPFPRLYQMLANVCGYENINDMPEAERQGPELVGSVNDLIAGATERSGRTGNAGRGKTLPDSEYPGY